MLPEMEGDISNVPLLRRGRHMKKNEKIEENWKILKTNEKIEKIDKFEEKKKTIDFSYVFFFFFQFVNFLIFFELKTNWENWKFFMNTWREWWENSLNDWNINESSFLVSFSDVEEPSLPESVQIWLPPTAIESSEWVTRQTNHTGGTQQDQGIILGHGNVSWKCV
jgi:hypothetical protein